jgi:DNA-binding IscR family transcriptional regulator
MTSLKFATATHVMLLLAHAGADTPAKALSSAYLASSIGANAVVVRRVLAGLAAAKLVTTRTGAGGGAWLAVKPAKIRLSQIFDAVEEPSGPGFRPKGNSACPVGRAAPPVICALIGEMRKASQAVLARQNLADLLKKLEAAAAT